LNLGHTVGHAVECISGYAIPHGEAVSIGLVAEARLAEGIGLAQAGLSEQIACVLSGLGLPVEIPATIRAVELVSAMQADKKRLDGRLRFSLPTTIGEVLTGIRLEADQIISILNHQKVKQP